MSDEKILEYKDVKKVPVRLRGDIKLGEAEIISDFSGERKEYKIMIDKIYLNDTDDNKSFVIRIIDDELINQTGGIIRGLSRKSDYARRESYRNCYKCISIKPSDWIWSFCRFGFRKYGDLLNKSMII